MEGKPLQHHLATPTLRTAANLQVFLSPREGSGSSLSHSLSCLPLRLHFTFSNPPLNYQICSFPPTVPTVSFFPPPRYTNFTCFTFRGPCVEPPGIHPSGLVTTAFVVSRATVVFQPIYYLRHALLFFFRVLKYGKFVSVGFCLASFSPLSLYFTRWKRLTVCKCPALYGERKRIQKRRRYFLNVNRVPGVAPSIYLH